MRSLAGVLALSLLGCAAAPPREPETAGAEQGSPPRTRSGAQSDPATSPPPPAADAPTSPAADAPDSPPMDAPGSPPADAPASPSHASPVPPPPLALTCPGAAPHTAADASDTAGRIDPNPIREVVAANQRDVAACYERYALPDPPSGRVSVRWVVAPNGTVSRAEVAQDTLGSTPIARCLLREVCTWRFPAPVRGSVTITYPFLFGGPAF